MGPTGPNYSSCGGPAVARTQGLAALASYVMHSRLDSLAFYIPSVCNGFQHRSHIQIITYSTLILIPSYLNTHKLILTYSLHINYAMNQYSMKWIQDSIFNNKNNDSDIINKAQLWVFLSQIKPQDPSFN